MKILYKKIKCRGERGQGIVEIGLGIALVAVVSMLVLRAVGDNSSSLLGGTADEIGDTMVLPGMDDGSKTSYVTYKTSETDSDIVSADYYTLKEGEVYDGSPEYIPDKYGAAFDFWAIKDENGDEVEATNEVITELITGGVTKIDIYPVYKSKGTYNVTIQRTYKGGNAITISTTPIDMSHSAVVWFDEISQNSKKTRTYYLQNIKLNGEIISYSGQARAFPVNGEDLTIIADYDDYPSTTTDRNVISIEKSEPYYGEDGQARQTFISVYSLPDDEVERSGFLYVKREASVDELVYPNKANVESWETCGRGNLDTIILTVRKASLDEKITTRAYVITKSGNILYSDVINSYS